MIMTNSTGQNSRRGLDEPSCPDALETVGRPFVVVWRVIDRCNLSCPFCAYDKTLGFPRQAADGVEVRRVVALLGALQRKTKRPYLVSWLGGEPTLWKDLEEVAALTTRVGLAQSLTTNGTTLGSPGIRDLFLRCFSEVTVSIDGFGDVHDSLRGWRNAFEKLRLNVGRLVEEKRAVGSDMKLRANIVLMHNTVDRFPELCLELADWGIEEITFNQLGGRDRPEFYPQNRLSPEDADMLSGFLPDLRLRLFDKGTTLLGGPSYVQRISDSARDVALAVADCRVAEDFWFIDETGVIAPCNYVEAHFGLKTTDLPDVDAFESLGSRLCTAQRTCPASACANCMSTQQFSKFAA